MISRVFNFMDKYHMVEKGDIIAVGVSGGADSLCLLEILMKYKKKVDFTPVVVHINHMLRKEAYEEAEYVRGICKQLGVDFCLKEISVKQLAMERRISEEEAGRMARYEAFREVLSCYNKEACKKKIAVAHHRQDVAETLLFNLFRGTGIYGMAGIMPCRDQVIRPLLNVSRKQIEEYLLQEGVHWCTDSTNEKDIYTRNKIRHHILPYAEQEINKESISHIAGAALQMAELRDYLDNETDKAATICCRLLTAEEASGQTIALSLNKIKGYHAFIQKQLILWCIGQVIPGRKDVGTVHIEAVTALMKKNGNGRLNLPAGLSVQKEYDIIYFRNSENVSRSIHHYPLDGENILETRLIPKKDFTGIKEKKYTKFIDYDKINNCPTLRFRESGDYLTINEKGQRKKLKDYFINEKIPSSQRDNIPLIADGSHIIWVVGYRLSAYYKVSDETERILQLTIRRKE